MSKYILIVFLVFNAWMAKAHQPDIFSTLLIQRESGDWLLQVRSALTAFEYEVENHYGADSYTTPEEFKALLIDHIAEHLGIYVNALDTALLDNAVVKLGHETVVVFEVMELPTFINSIKIQNSCFENIRKNQNVLSILKTGFSTREQFILNEENHHTVDLILEDSTFILAPTKVHFSYLTPRSIVLSMVLLCGIGTLLMLRRKQIQL